MRLLWTPLLFGLICGQAASRDVAPSVSTPLPGQVLVSGTVPDEASKAAILARVREVYGAEKVVDQLSIGSVILPANWILSPILHSRSVVPKTLVARISKSDRVLWEADEGLYMIPDSR